jgi:hypothetical protein
MMFQWPCWPFKVAGVGKALRIYDIGKKKLLHKVENKVRLFWFK